MDLSPILSLVLVRAYLKTSHCPACLVWTNAVFFPGAVVFNRTCAIGANTKSVKRVQWNVKCEKPMTVMPVLSLDHWSTNVKGHYDISAKSSTRPIFFPERLQSDLYRCPRYLYAHAYIAYLPLLHYVTVYLAGYPATREVVNFYEPVQARLR